MQSYAELLNIIGITEYHWSNSAQDCTVKLQKILHYCLNTNMHYVAWFFPPFVNSHLFPCTGILTFVFLEVGISILIWSKEGAFYAGFLYETQNVLAARIMLRDKKK